MEDAQGGRHPLAVRPRRPAHRAADFDSNYAEVNPAVTRARHHLPAARQQGSPTPTSDVDAFRVELYGGATGLLFSVPDSAAPHLRCWASHWLLGSVQQFAVGGRQAVVDDLLPADGGLTAQDVFYSAATGRDECALAQVSEEPTHFLYGGAGAKRRRAAMGGAD